MELDVSYNYALLSRAYNMAENIETKGLISIVMKNLKSTGQVETRNPKQLELDFGTGEQINLFG